MILIIDDDIAIRTSLTLLLKQQGLNVSAVVSPEQAYPALRSENISLVMLDMNFSMETSGAEGLAALNTIRKLRPDVPVIMITAYGDGETERRAIAGGAEALLSKPLDFDLLRTRIDRRLQAGA